MIEIVRTDLKLDRTPYIESSKQRAPVADDFYKKTIYHDNGKPEEIAYYKGGTVTTSYFDISGKEIRKTRDAYDVLPMSDII